MSKEESVKAMVESALQYCGRLDIACNSAALSRGSGPIHEFEREVFDQTLEMCLTNTWLCMKYEIPAMLARGGGAIVAISSLGSRRVIPDYVTVGTSKAAIEALVRYLGVELAPHGINVNAISPTFVDTPQVAMLLDDPDFKAGLLARIPLNRVGGTEDLVGAAIFFCSDASSFITGQILGIDGGLTATQ